MIKLNNTIKKLLLNESIFDLAKKRPLETRLENILNKGFLVINDAIVFSMFKNNIKRCNYPDLTGIEMFSNKFHIDTYLKKEQGIDYILQQSIAFALALKERLEKNYPQNKFKIIVSTENNEFGFTSTIGFHKVRPKEFWLVSDLETYKHNGLLVISISK